MVTRVDSSLPAVPIQTRSYATPIIAALALAAIGYLLIQVAKCLIGRVESITSAERLYNQGCDDYKNGKNPEAIQRFTLALQLMPDQQLRAKILADRAVAYSENEKPNEALADFESALACHPTADVLLLIYSNRATFFTEQNGHATAVIDYDRALGLSFSDNDFHAMIFCRRAISHYMLENYDQSLSDFNAAFALDPQDQYLRAQILAYRSGTNVKLNQPETVLKDLRDALACSFDDPNLRRFIYRSKGDFWALTGAHAEAVFAFNQACYCEPYREDVFAQLVYKRGCSFSALERWDDALRDFTDAFASEFSDDQLRANILGGRAIVHIMQEQFQLAANDLNAAIEFNPSEDLDQMLYMRALVYTKLKRLPEAIKDFTATIAMNSDDEDRKAALLLERARTHRENKRPDLAVQDFEAALRCKITKEGLREALEAELNPKTASPASKLSVFLGWLTTKFPGSQKK